MTKFIISNLPETNEDLPVLYDILFAGRYYLHKGKKLKESADRFLEDVFRGMRDKSCPEQYKKVVEFCKKYPAIYQVQVSLLMNDTAPKILKKEKSLLKKRVRDLNSLNIVGLEPYTPEWMLKQSLQERCDNPITEGTVNGKKLKFKFCPNCGRLNK
jgi:hypothetical protein